MANTQGPAQENIRVQLEKRRTAARNADICMLADESVNCSHAEVMSLDEPGSLSLMMEMPNARVRSRL